MEDLKNRLLLIGASLVGFASLTPVPESVRDGFPFAVSIAVTLDPSVIREISKGPTRDYFADYNRANSVLAELGCVAVEFLSKKGFHARMVEPTTEGYNRGTNSVRFQHKTAATRAGLGWIGKCALLVTREYGSAIRLVTVLTEAALPVGKAIDSSACGTCMACVEHCPAGAPTGKEWEVGMERGVFFNAALCRNMAKELSGRIGLNETICGICIVSCPWTQAYLKKK